MLTGAVTQEQIDKEIIQEFWRKHDVAPERYLIILAGEVEKLRKNNEPGVFLDHALVQIEALAAEAQAAYSASYNGRVCKCDDLEQQLDLARNR